MVSYHKEKKKITILITGKNIKMNTETLSLKNNPSTSNPSKALNVTSNKNTYLTNSTRSVEITLIPGNTKTIASKIHAGSSTKHATVEMIQKKNVISKPTTIISRTFWPPPGCSAPLYLTQPEKNSQYSGIMKRSVLNYINQPTVIIKTFKSSDGQASSTIPRSLLPQEYSHCVTRTCPVGTTKTVISKYQNNINDASFRKPQILKPAKFKLLKTRVQPLLVLKKEKLEVSKSTSLKESSETVTERRVPPQKPILINPAGNQLLSKRVSFF